jgi:hypothetical protein
MRGPAPARPRAAIYTKPRSAKPKWQKPKWQKPKWQKPKKQRTKTIIKKAKPKSVPVKTIYKTRTKYVPRPKKPSGGSFSRGFHTGKAIGETIAPLIGAGERHG